MRSILSRIESAAKRIPRLKEHNPNGNYVMPDLSKVGNPQSETRVSYLAQLEASSGQERRQRAEEYLRQLGI